MPIPPMRPTFEIDFTIEPRQAIDRLSALVDDADHPVDGRIAGTHLMLVIPKADRHFWSPWLHIEVHGHQSGSTINGRFSPNPSVWTGFMLAYIALATLVFFAAMFGIGLWMMDKPASTLVLIPALLVIAGVLYWASLIGQKLAHAQMLELYNASMGALAETQPP